MFEDNEDHSLVELLNLTDFTVKLSGADLVDGVDVLPRCAHYLDYLSIQVPGFSLDFIKPVMNRKLSLSSNRSMSLKFKGPGIRPHFFLPIGKYMQEYIYVLFQDGNEAENLKQPRLLDTDEADRFYYAIACSLAECVGTFDVPSQARSLVDTEFRIPTKKVEMDTLYVSLTSLELFIDFQFN
jgi:hypothetical protein